MRFGPFVDLVFDGLFLVEVGDYFYVRDFFVFAFSLSPQTFQDSI